MAVLSIIVPVFNKEKYIDACIQSILAQTFTDFELILINDGSTDGSGLKCDYYNNIDQRIIVLHQENQGVSAARNKGIFQSCGTFLGFVDADDTIEKDMYLRLINNALNYEAEISVCRLKESMDIKAEQPNTNVEIFNNDEGISGFFKGRLDYSACNKIFAGKIAKQIQFEGVMFEDALFIFQAFLISKKTVLIQDALYNYFNSNNSASLSKFNLKYLDIVHATRKMTDTVLEKAPIHSDDALILDFVMNLSILNLILFAKKEKYWNEYINVVTYLQKLSKLFKNPKLIDRKHRIAYNIFRTSSSMYFILLRLYCRIFPTQIGHRI